MKNGFWYHHIMFKDNTEFYKAVCTAPMNAMTFIQRTTVNISDVCEVNDNVFRIYGLYQANMPEDVRKTYSKTFFDTKEPSYIFEASDIVMQNLDEFVKD